MERFEKLSDEELISCIQAGEKECMDVLIERYKRQVRNQARALYLIGGDGDDLIQEGMIGLFKAIRDYQPEKEAAFEKFAQLCISRQLYSAIQASNRQKHVPLNSYVELSPRLGEGAGDPREKSPEELVMDQETLKGLYARIQDVLSPFERRVLEETLSGRSYKEIADEMGKSSKSVDNAIQRIRRKLNQTEQT